MNRTEGSVPQPDRREDFIFVERIALSKDFIHPQDGFHPPSADFIIGIYRNDKFQATSKNHFKTSGQ